MQKWLVGALTTLMFVGVLALPAAAGESSFTLYTHTWSKYLVNKGVLVHDKPVLQTGLTYAAGGGFFLDLWHSSGLDGTSLSSDFGDETDYTVWWSGKVESLDLQVGLAYFDLFPLFSTKNDILQPYGEVTRSFALTTSHTVSPYIRVEVGIPMRDGVPRRGAHAYFGTRHDWHALPFLAINHRGWLLYDTGAYGFDNGVLYGYRLDTNWAITKALTVSVPSVKFTGPLAGIHDRRKHEGIVGVGFSLWF